MNERDEEDEAPIDAELEQALRAVMRPVARTEFKNRLRERFVARMRAVEGEMPDRQALAEAAAVRRSFEAEPALVPSPGRRAGRRGWGVLLAAASIALIGWIVWPRRSGWQVLDGLQAQATVSVDGQALGSADREHLEHLLASAHDIESGASSLRLRYGDLCVLELAPDTRIALSAFESASPDQPMRIDTRSGAVRVCTSSKFSGSKMLVATPEFEVTVVGTSFAVDIVPEGSCVCCLNGSVAIQSVRVGESGRTIESGKMCLVYRDPVPPKWDVVYEPHAAPLRKLDQFAHELFK